MGSSPIVHRALDPEPVASLDDHRRDGPGWEGMTADPESIIAMIDEAGLRGRGGAGFPTATKWRTVREHTDSSEDPTTVVVNGAEGEPGSFKDRLLLRRNPYKILEGAVIAAAAIGAERIVVATKESFGPEAARLRDAIDQMESRSVDGPDRIEVVLGPDVYLFGEETALLEVVARRGPFPRVAPPWRRGVDDESEPAAVVMATADDGTTAAPTLVNNVETLAHVADIARHGPEWFREFGTPDATGTMLCTVTGDVGREGVLEVPLGTTIAEIRAAVGGSSGTPLAVLPGVSHPLIAADRFDLPLGYGDETTVHAGAGALRFFDEGTDVVAIAAGVARFLAIESCGQCLPCKTDGLELSKRLERLAGNDSPEDGLDRIVDLTRTVTDGARCSLATQIREIVSGVLVDFPDEPTAHLARLSPSTEPVLIAPLESIEDGRAVIDETHRSRQPDWSHDQVWSGSYPAQEIDVAL